MISVAMTLVALPLVFAIALPLLLIGQEVTAPSWITRRVEAQAGTMLAGGDLDFGAITVTLGTDLHPRIGLRDTVLRDASGAVLARVPEIDALVSPRGLLFNREALAQEVVLRGAEVGLRRESDGRVALRFDRAPTMPGRPAARGAPRRRAEGLAGLLQQIDRLFERPALAALEQVRSEGLVINYDDARAGRSWTVDEGRLTLDLRDGRTRLSGGASVLSGRSYVTKLMLDYDRAPRAKTAQMALQLTDVASRDIASQHPALSFLSVLDAPLSAAIRGTVGLDGRPGPFSAALQIGEGALAPGRGTDGIGFDSAALYLQFDPEEELIAFDRIAVVSDWGGVSGSGRAWLREMTDGWPGALVGQLQLDQLTLNPGGIFDAPVELRDAWLDLRLRDAPFAIELGGFGLSDADTGARLTGSGQVDYFPEGWRVALDARVNTLPVDRLMALWPDGFRPGIRDWFDANVAQGVMTDTVVGLRLDPGGTPVMALTQGFRDATVKILRDLPPITGAAGRASMAEDRFSLALETGAVDAPEGGVVDLAGSRFVIPDLAAMPDRRAEVALRGAGPIPALLSLLDQPPFGFLQKAGQPVTLASGRAEISADLALPLGRSITGDEVSYAVTGTLRDVASEVVVPGRSIAAAALDLAVSPEALLISGPVSIGAVPADISFTRPLGQPDAAATLAGTVEISQRFLDEFGIALPPGTLDGRGRGEIEISLPPGAAPRFALGSDLAGVGLAIPSLGWTLPRGAGGRFDVAGQLGPVPRIDKLSLEAGGLSASGRLSLRPGGGLDRAEFDRVRLGGWLDVPAVLVGRGPGATVGIEVGGGTLDLRRADFGAGGGGDGGPMAVALDRLQVTKDIALTGFRGDFSSAGGFSGRFAASVNGAAPIDGLVVPDRRGVALRLTGSDAGAVMRAAGLYGTATGGDIDLTLLPTGQPGSYDGELLVQGLRIRDAPAMAQLLDAISVVGLLQRLDGQGLAFDRIAASFRLDPETLTVTKSSASGPGLGISLDGLYSLASRNMDFQGVISPFYMFNAIGSVLTRPGEGLIGFSYRLRGTPEMPQVSVNPLSVLTPGMFREIFRRPPPQPGQ